MVWLMGIPSQAGSPHFPCVRLCCFVISPTQDTPPLPVLEIAWEPRGIPHPSGRPIAAGWDSTSVTGLSNSKDLTPPSSKFQRLCPPIFCPNPPASDSPTARTFCPLIAFCNILFRWPVGQELVNCGEFQSNRAIGLALVARAIRYWSALTDTFL